MSKNSVPAPINRRAFLQGTLACATVAATRLSSLTATEDRSTSDKTGDAASKSVLERMKGPIASITMPYNKDYSIDYGSLRNWVEFMCVNKVPILMLTYGDSELYNLTTNEIAKVIRTVADQARGRALVLGGTPKCWTGELVNFINSLEDSGVDAMSVHHYSRNEEEIERALSQVSEKTRLPLLAYESKWSVDLVKRVAKIPRFIGMKCHAELYAYYDMIRETKNDDFAVMSAGQMKHFLFGYLIGSTAYLCPLTPFAPKVGTAFYDALKKGDIPAARKFVYDYEEPLLKVTIPLGYPQAYKSELYLIGKYGTPLIRPPKKSNTVEELGPLREFIRSKPNMPAVKR